MKERRKIIIEYTEKDVIYIHNLIEILVKKFNEKIVKKRTVD